jgi:glycerophosphoryl diester phosphodiesterase
MRASNALDVWPSHEHVTETLVREVHDEGGRVIPWTVNDEKRAIALSAMGVDALCTDFLSLLRVAL